MQITPIHVSVMRNNMAKSSAKQNNDVSFKARVPQAVADDFLSTFKRVQQDTASLIKANVRSKEIAQMVDAGKLQKGSVGSDLPKTIKTLTESREKGLQVLADATKDINKKTFFNFSRVAKDVDPKTRSFAKFVKKHLGQLDESVKLSKKGISQEPNTFSTRLNEVSNGLSGYLNKVSDGAEPAKKPVVSHEALESFFAEA